MTRDLETFDLPAAMRNLYKTGEYYAVLPPGPNSGSSDIYWTKPMDPDGNIRDRFAERETYLRSVRHELDFISNLTPGRVLDIGCGPGWLLSAINPAWSRYGIEKSKVAGELASKHTTVFIGSLGAAIYPPASFDLAITYHVIEHLVDPITAIHRIHELLRPDGVLIIATPDFDSGCARRFGSNYRLLQDPTHISLFSNDSMHRFLRDHGFQIMHVDYPYFQTCWFNRENLLRILNEDNISPPFYGNFMTFYCHRS